MKRITSYIIIVTLIFMSGNVLGQDQGFIYGKVTTIDGNEYTGALRWGKEEVYWSDIFNSTKTNNIHYKYLSSQEKRQSGQSEEETIWNITDIWTNKYSRVVHQFACRFGDIKSIEIIGRERLILTFKDNSSVELAGGSNDIGTSIRIHDFEIGEMKIRWDRIERIDFMETPRKLDDKFGSPLYGEVETLQNGSFTGYIQWDHDERVGSDKLDGDSRDGDMSIAFEKIRIIRKEGNRSYVELKSGRNMVIGGSNDVDSGNRGIIVSIDGKGRVDIPWSQFKQVKFQETKDSGQPYKSYPSPKQLEGKVIMINDEEVSGKIIYDIDEVLDLELVQGKDDDVEYIIPFRDIRSIRPRNYNYSTVEFRNGEKVLIGDARDVNDSNGGILVFERGNKSPVYIPWTKVSEVIFN